LADIGEIYKVRLELSPIKQSQEPEWKIRTVRFLFLLKKIVVVLCSNILHISDYVNLTTG